MGSVFVLLAISCVLRLHLLLARQKLQAWLYCRDKQTSALLKPVSVYKSLLKSSSKRLLRIQAVDIASRMSGTEYPEKMFWTVETSYVPLLEHF